MSIHHATVKRATDMGVILSERLEDGVPVFTAHWTRRNQKLEGENVKLLVDEMAALIDMRSNFKSFKWKEEDDGQKTVFCTKPKISATNDYLNRAFEQARDAWREAMQNDDSIEDQTGEEGDDEDEEDEPTPTGSVVSPRYRALYAEKGHPTHCGDWLAQTLIDECTNASGINMLVFDEIAALNGVDLSKYDRLSHGWQGRIRMTGRNIMARRIVLLQDGVLHLPGDRHLAAPPEWLNDPKQQKYSKGRKKDPSPAAVLGPAPEPEPVEEPKPEPEPVISDRFGVNPPGEHVIQPRKGRGKKAA